MQLLSDLPSIELAGPRAAPLFGGPAKVLGFFADPIGVMLRLTREFGDLVPLVHRNPSWVMAIGSKYNQPVLSDQTLFQNSADLPIKLRPDSAPVRLNAGLTSMNGEEHKRHRRLMMPAFSRNSVLGYHGEMVAVTERLLSQVCSDAVVDISALGTQLALTVAMQCLYGVDVEQESGELGHLAMALLDGILNPANILLPAWLPFSPLGRFVDRCERLQTKIRRLISDRRDQPTRGKDVLSLLVAARDEDGSSLSEDELLGHASVLFLAGHETTANTLAWTLLLLAQHPEVLAAVEEEVRSTLGLHAPGPDDLERMPLLDSVIKESMRLLPASSILFFRRASAEFELGGTRFPSGTTLLLSTLMTHRDPKVFPEPYCFRPDRWRTQEANLYQYLPFGAGPRMCIGATFARQFIPVMLAMLLQRFRFSLLPGTRVDRRIRGITLGMKTPLKMRSVQLHGKVPPPARVRGDLHQLVTVPS